jgi:hypothetical protein
LTGHEKAVRSILRTAFFSTETDYFVPVVEPVDDAPVVPVVPVLLEVPALPLVLGVVADEPVDEPMPEVEPETELPELPEAGAVEELEVAGEVDDGDTEPDAVPVEEPMPEAEPEAVPDALGPVELHAARVNAQASGTIHLIIVTPSFITVGR